MANTIKLKRGTSTPSTSDISSGEVAIDTSAQKLFINDSGTVKEIGGGGIADGDKGDITVSSSGATWTIDSGATQVANKLPLTGGTMTGSLRLNDDLELQLGSSGSDLKLFHNGTDSYINNSTGNLFNRSTGNIYLQVNGGSNENALVAKTNSATELYFDNVRKLRTLSNGVELDDNFYLLDGKEIRLGSGEDLRLFHSSSHSFIRNTTGNLYIGGTDGHDGNVVVQATYGEESIWAKHNGSVELFFDNSKKIETTSWGCDVHGTLRADDITLQDSHVLKIGSDNDLQLTHSGNDSTISKTTAGNLLIYVEEDFYLKHGTELMIAAKDDSTTELYFDGSKKLQTGSGGIVVSGSYYTNDNNKLILGSDNDLQIYHTSTNSLIKHEGAGDLYIDSYNKDIYIRSGDGNTSVENAISCINNAQVELYYSGLKKLATTADGVNVSDESGAVHLRLYTGTSTLRGYLYADDSNRVYLLDAQGHAIVYGQKDAHCSLYYDNSQKFYTQATKNVSAGDFFPESSNTYDLGSSSYRWRNIYTNDLNLSNEGGSNDVDGTWGDWTLQEGDKNIFMINNRTGKKYRMNLTEVS